MSNETADLLGHVLLFAQRNKIDLEAAIKRKWQFDVAADPDPSGTPDAN